MEFEIDQARFLSALALAQTVADKRSNNMPILANVLLRTTKDNRLVCSATDMMISITETIPVEVKTPGALTLAVVQRAPEAPAWAVGVMMSGLFAGAVAGPLVVGLLAEHDHFSAAWCVCSAFALLSAGTILATRRSGTRAAVH